MKLSYFMNKIKDVKPKDLLSVFPMTAALCQYEEGYFDYHNNPFGTWCAEADTVVDQIEKNVLSDFVMSEESQSEYKKIFPYCDMLNSERIYNVLRHNEGK